MGMGKGLLDSLIAEGGVKSRDLRKLGIYMGMDIEIRRGRSDRNAAKFYGYPYLLVGGGAYGRSHVSLARSSFS